MPESRSEQIRHSNEELANFLICGDARGPAWLATHPEHRARALSRLSSRHAMSDPRLRVHDEDPQAIPGGSALRSGGPAAAGG